MAKILGFSAFYHDSAAAATLDGQVIAAAQEERFTRIKHDKTFPKNAIRYCLEETGWTIDELDAVVFYDKPLLKFERLLETYYAFAPKGLRSFVKAIPVWLDEKMFFRRHIRQGLQKVMPFDKKNLRLLFPEHHLSHAASAFYASPFQEAAILTVDGVGEYCTASIGKGEGSKIRLLQEMHFPHSVGLLYSAFTYFLGFKVNSGEYKLMGLAPYGNPHSAELREMKSVITEELVEIYEDGSIQMNMDYFTYPTGLRMAEDTRWTGLFGFPRRKEGDPITQGHCNLALAIQQVTETAILKMAKQTKEITGMDKLCLAGGVALNCVTNGKLIKEGIFEQVFIQPAAGDAGGALGAALAGEYIYYENEREAISPDAMKGSLLGPYFSKKEVERMNRKWGAQATYIDDFGALCEKAASLLADGNILGWFQGRMEYGPRALGNRSILADPARQDMQQKLNLSIKYRESFRPFAPSVLKEDASQYFELEGESPYMLLTAQVKATEKFSFDESYYALEMKERLQVRKSNFPAITHVDGSARVQTVDQQRNPRFHQLLQVFKEKSGHGMLVNTSFNVRGEPIVHSPDDAFRCFMSTVMDVLVIGDFLYLKNEQRQELQNRDWKREFDKD